MHQVIIRWKVYTNKEGCDFLTDQNKIILMTKLALYEKKDLEKDKKIMAYYIEDYIYLNNLKARLGFTIVMLIFMGIDILNTIVTDIVIPTSLWEFVKIYVSPYVLPWGIGIGIYTAISTYIYGKKYRESQRRYLEYRKLSRELDEYEQEEMSAEGDTYGVH